MVTRQLDLAVKAGLSRQGLVDAAGLRHVDLTDPDARVPLSAEVALWQLLAKHINDPGFGIRGGASTRVREAGLLGYAIASSGTLGAALQRLVRFSRLLSESVEFHFEQPAGPYVAIAEVRTALGAGLPFAVDYRLASALSVCRQITGVDLLPVEIDFAYDQPASTIEHRRYFRCPLRFGQPVTSVRFLERDLALPTIQGDETLAGYLSEYAEQVLRSLVVGTSIRERVHAAIWSELSNGRPRLSRIASAVGIPPRTLQRHLAAEGTSLHAEVEAIRKAMGIAALKTRSASVEDIAFFLGYTEPSTFFRAFKRWTGTTPDRYRRAAG